MEVKPGYKKTEVGVIPEEWDVKRLGDLGTVVRGGSPRPAGDPRYFNGNFIPWLTVAALTNVSEHHLTISETVSCLTEEGSKHSRTLVDGTLVLANSGATLGVAKLLGVTCCANDGIAAIINQQMGEKAFICSYINTQTKHLREVIATGNGQPNLNTDLIREITIPFPPLAEQHAIAEVLGDVDALLGSLEKLIAKKRDLKQAAMQQLLTGKKRLPGFGNEGTCFKQSEVGVIPADWRVAKIQEHAAIKTGNRNTQDRITDGQYPFFVRSQIVERIGSYSFDGEAVLTAGDGVGTGKIFHYIKGRFDYHQRVYRISNFTPDLDGFFFFLVFSTRFYDRIMSMTAKSSVDSVRMEMIADMQIAFPPTRAEQTAIAEVLSDMDAELAALEQRLAKTRDLKQGMMQELLTGRTRLV